jgi:hypothetical protein
MASIQDLYLQILGRPADPGGEAFYAQQLASGAKTLDQIKGDLQYAVDTGLENKAVNQAITQATTQAAVTLPTTLQLANNTLAVAPSDAGIASLINQVYQDELGGNADAGGLQFYTNLYKSGVPIENIRAQIDDSPENPRHLRYRPLCRGGTNFSRRSL